MPNDKKGKAESANDPPPPPPPIDLGEDIQKAAEESEGLEIRPG